MSFADTGRYGASNTERIASFSSFDGGIKLGNRWSDSEHLLSYSENLLPEGGALGSRKGQSYCIEQTLGTCHGAESFNDSLYIHGGTHLYKWDCNPEHNPTEVHTVRDAESIMFTFGGKLYIADGEHYYCTDGTTFDEVVPYIPTVIVGRGRAARDGDVHEALNMIGRGFETWFNFEGDGIYILPYKDLANDTISATLNGSDITSFCSVDRTDGTVLISGRYPGDEGINNLKITAYLKSSVVAEDKSKVLGCRMSELFGGTDGNGTRVFFSGNPDYPTHIFRSGLLDPTYFPDTDFELVGFANDRISAMKKQYGELMVLCEKSIHAVSYIFSDNEVIFSSRTVNSEIGCDMPHSVQLVNNNVVFGNSKRGIYMITSGVSENENNVVPLSSNVNLSEDGILKQSKDELKAAYSADYDDKYWLFVGSKCYVWDYGARSYPVGTTNFSKAQKSLCWYIQSNMQAICPVVIDGGLYYGHPDGKFVKYGDGYTDFDEDIPRMAFIALTALGAPSREKKIHDICAVFDAYGEVEINLKFYRNGVLTGSSYETCELCETGGSAGDTVTVNAAVAIPKAYSFAVKIEIDGARMTLRRLDLKYRL